MRSIKFGFFFFFFPLFSSAQWHRIAPPRAWVEPISLKGLAVTDTACASGGVQYLLLDNQINIAEERFYGHVATRLVTPEGVQNGSRIEVDVDPTYETVDLHMARVIRNGVVIDQLVPGNISVIQRESEMGNYLYDGTRTVVIELKDVRPGDIIEEAYTLIGRNPADLGKYYMTMRMGYGVPLALLHLRFIEPENRTFQYKTHLLEHEPITSLTKLGRERIYKFGPTPCIRSEMDAPGWYDPFPMLEVSEFEDLEGLRAWAVAQYDVDLSPSKEMTNLIAQLNAIQNRAARIDSAIHVVQRTVRYLGLEDGISAYRPHPPAQVLAQRFGDCKDRSLLLVQLLRNIGVKAWPALVNTTLGPKLEDYLPRPTLFDHCIVHLEEGGESYWIDPTMANNHGSLQERYAPDRGCALIVDPARTGWDHMKTDRPGTLEMTERFTIPDIGGGGELRVETHYTGREADRMRSQFAGSSLSEISANYMNYYLNYYGKGETTEPLRFNDDTEGNRFSTYEHYEFESIWDSSDVSTRSELHFRVGAITDYVRQPSERYRTAPFYLGRPVSVIQHIEVEMPSEWTLGLEDMEIDKFGVRYRSSSHVEGRMVYFENEYHIDSAVVQPADIPEFMDQQDAIQNDLSMYLFSDPDAIHSFSEKFWAYGALLLIIALSIWGAVRLYHYDPQPITATPAHLETNIGSWMILPLIGLCLSPIRLIADMFSEEMYFFHSALEAPHSAVNDPGAFQLYCYGSQAYTIGILALTIISIVLFVKKRTSVPYVMVGTYLAIAFFTITDRVLYGLFDLEELTGISYGSKEIIQSIVPLFVWVPYFLISERVRTTFTKRLHELPPGYPPAELTPVSGLIP